MFENKSFTVEVSEDCLKFGHPMSPKSCPIAIGVIEDVPDDLVGTGFNVFIRNNKTYIESYMEIDGDDILVSCIFNHDNYVTEFIDDFDNGEDVSIQEVEYTVDRVDESLKDDGYISVYGSASLV